VLSQNPTYLADSAHNEGGIKELLSIINNFSFNKLHFVYGTVSDKDLSKIFPLLPKNAQYYLCKPNIPRGMNVDVLLENTLQNGFNATAFSSVIEAFEAAKLNAQKDDLIVVSGSIFVVAEVI
jgi:dihydrofolate synthase/folylpolyglutamate synthase